MDAEKPDRVIVQGDTATAMAGALAAYYRKIPVDHVEAGLRSGNIYHPWPEEVNRKIIGTIARPALRAHRRGGRAARRERRSRRVHVTGNTVIDALHWVTRASHAEPRARGLADLEARFAGKRIIGVTSPPAREFRRRHGRRSPAPSADRRAARRGGDLPRPPQPQCPRGDGRARWPGSTMSR
jgi:UDP-N-acetylglucosamine 2-epimerase (non-hydrolysing)